jgi:hypothetical protein
MTSRCHAFVVSTAARPDSMLESLQSTPCTPVILPVKYIQLPVILPLFTGNITGYFSQTIKSRFARLFQDRSQHVNIAEKTGYSFRQVTSLRHRKTSLDYCKRGKYYSFLDVVPIGPLYRPSGNPQTRAIQTKHSF